jgi:pyrroline-5-carboxylate reductase
MSQETLAFIGGGNMTRSLVGGLVAGGRDPASITVAEPDVGQREALTADFGVATTGDNRAAAADAETVVLAVKPQVLPEVAAELAAELADPDKLVVSIAAGIRLDRLREWLGSQRPLVRVMPNTPALVGAGISAVYADPGVTVDQRGRVSDLLAAAGESVWLDKEEQMDAVTAVSGSGPAYFFLILEALEEAGVAQGLPRATARELATATAGGAARLASESDAAPSELRTRVTSPAGTTAEGLAGLERGGLRATFLDAVAAAARRSRELGS